MGLRKEEPARDTQYNVIQQIAYTSVLIMAAIVVATGFALFKPTQLWWLTAAFGGYETARAIHLVMTFALVSFFLVHIVQVARSGFANFWSMITGFELISAKDVPKELQESDSEEELADV